MTRQPPEDPALGLLEAAAYNPASSSSRLRQYRELRTKMVLELGWRCDDDLVDGVDHDRYDEPGSVTTSIVVSAQDGPVAGGRITVSPVNPANSLSFEMWRDSGLNPEVDDVLSRWCASGRMLEVTRLVSCLLYTSDAADE